MYERLGVYNRNKYSVGVYKMLIRLASYEDIDNWKEIAADVAELFNSPNMPNEDSFMNYMVSKIKRKEAFVATDKATNNIYGIIGFSRKNNSISWFGVREKSRGAGIGEKLLSQALNELGIQKDISVITFGEKTKDGLSARRLYFKMGFIEVEKNIVDAKGNKGRCKMIKPALT